MSAANAVIYAVQRPGAQCGWKWRATEGADASQRTFTSVLTCVHDARKRGYATVRFQGAAGVRPRSPQAFRSRTDRGSELPLPLRDPAPH
jgi:hypothetical protein